MGRPQARITHDEIYRLIKGVQSAGLTIARVTFNGEKVEVFTAQGILEEEDDDGLIREPKL